MKKILLFLFFLFMVNHIKATHIIGGELSYQCIGNGQYQIEYTYYRDCQSYHQPLINCNVNSCGTYLDVTLTLDSLSIEQIVPACSQLTKCNGGTNPGIEKWIFKGIVTLPSPCENTFFSIWDNARSISITTIQDPANFNFYISAVANDTNLFCDSSPIFTNAPVIFTCVNEPYCLDPGIYDADGDSLVCSLVAPLSDVNLSLPYDSGFSMTQPLISNPPVKFDSRTGTLCFTPTQPVGAIYVIQVDSYRNNILIGQVKRDIIVYAINCSNSQPDLSGLNGSNYYDTVVCVNSQNCFDISSNDPNLSDSTIISWDQGIPNATFISTPSKNESGQFCWTPGYNDVSNIPHCFNVRVQDNSCPARQTNMKQYCITVVDSVECAILSMGNSISMEEELKIYPQPANDFVTIDCGVNFNNKNLKFYIDDILGKKIDEIKISEKITLVHGLLPGIYFGYLIDDNDLVLKKRKFVVI